MCWMTFFLKVPLRKRKKVQKGWVGGYLWWEVPERTEWKGGQEKRAPTMRLNVGTFTSNEKGPMDFSGNSTFQSYKISSKNMFLYQNNNKHWNSNMEKSKKLLHHIIKISCLPCQLISCPKQSINIQIKLSINWCLSGLTVCCSKQPCSNIRAVICQHTAW